MSEDGSWIACAKSSSFPPKVNQCQLTGAEGAAATVAHRYLLYFSRTVGGSTSLFVIPVLVLKP